MTGALSRALTTLRDSQPTFYVVLTAAILAVHLAARALSLRMVTSISRFVLEAVPLVVVVLHHEELSRVLASVGGLLSSRLGSLGESHATDIIEELVAAAGALAARGLGGTIAIERHVSLRSDIERGVRLDAAITSELLTTIFDTASPLHDGAVVISDGRVAAARVFFPLTTNAAIARERGSRHQSAVGLTEGTDAMAIVVSEERRMVSLAFGGFLEPGTQDELRVKLRRLFSSRLTRWARSRSAKTHRDFHDWTERVPHARSWLGMTLTGRSNGTPTAGSTSPSSISGRAPMPACRKWPKPARRYEPRDSPSWLRSRWRREG